MTDDLELPGWRDRKIPHGFASAGATVASGLQLARATQVHGAKILTVDGNVSPVAGSADALLTATAGVAVSVATADCVPILLSARVGKPVAAVHAGWRGTLAGIAGVAVEAFSTFGIRAPEIEAVLGPSIGPCCFEVEDEFRERFREKIGDQALAFWQDGKEGHGTLDLRGINRLLLERSGVPSASIFELGGCTFCGDPRFASYRRDGEQAGRQLSWIGIR